MHEALDLFSRENWFLFEVVGLQIRDHLTLVFGILGQALDEVDQTVIHAFKFFLNPLLLATLRLKACLIAALPRSTAALAIARLFGVTTVSFLF